MTRHFPSMSANSHTAGSHCYLVFSYVGHTAILAGLHSHTLQNPCGVETNDTTLLNSSTQAPNICEISSLNTALPHFLLNTISIIIYITPRNQLLVSGGCSYIYKQDRQCACNVTQRSFRESLLPCKSDIKYYIFLHVALLSSMKRVCAIL